MVADLLKIFSTIKGFFLDIVLNSALTAVFGIAKLSFLTTIYLFESELLEIII